MRTSRPVVLLLLLISCTWQNHRCCVRNTVEGSVGANPPELGAHPRAPTSSPRKCGFGLAWGGLHWIGNLRRGTWCNKKGDGNEGLIAIKGKTTVNPSKLHRLLVSFVGALTLSGASVVVNPESTAASPFNPRPPPVSTRRPFFEGWCIRLVDHQRRVSFAVIIGSFRSKGKEGSELDQHYVSVSYMDPSEGGSKCRGDMGQGGEASQMHGDGEVREGKDTNENCIENLASVHSAGGGSTLWMSTPLESPERGDGQEGLANRVVGGAVGEYIRQQSLEGSYREVPLNKQGLASEQLEGERVMPCILGEHYYPVRTTICEEAEECVTSRGNIRVWPWNRGKEKYGKQDSNRGKREKEIESATSITEQGQALVQDSGNISDLEGQGQKTDWVWDLKDENMGETKGGVVRGGARKQQQLGRVEEDEVGGEGKNGSPTQLQAPYIRPSCVEKVHTFHAFPPADTVTISAGGTAVSHPPDMQSDPDFTWEADGLGSVTICGDEGRLSFELPEVSVAASFRQRVPWSFRHPNSDGPEGWLRNTPLLPCHYFVYSLGSEAGYSLKPCGKKAVVGRGSLHLEVNYGETFPTSWVWAQGCTSSIGMEGGRYENGERVDSFEGGTVGHGKGGESKDELGTPLARFVLTGGRFMIGPMATNSFVIGYRSEKLAWDFRTTDMDRIEASVSCSSGRLKLLAKSWKGDRVLEADIKAPVDSFGSPIYVPTSGGFDNVPGCIESYSAVASFRLYTRTGGKGTPLRLEEEVEVKVSALEFGGDFQFT